MASTVPIAGSAYTYAYATMGEFIAWLIGWDLILEYMVGATTVAIGWSGYVTSVLHGFGIDIPAQFTLSPGTRMVEIPNAVADKLHMRHGWTALSTVSELLEKNQIDFSGFQPGHGHGEPSRHVHRRTRDRADLLSGSKNRQRGPSQLDGGLRQGGPHLSHRPQ